MPTLTIKNIPTELYERLKKRAQEHRRSVNSEVIFCLERALRGRRVDPETFLSRVEALQKQITLPPLTDDVLRKAKEEGRL